MRNLSALERLVCLIVSGVIFLRWLRWLRVFLNNENDNGTQFGCDFCDIEVHN